MLDPPLTSTPTKAHWYIEFEAKTSMSLKHILYTLLCENGFRGPQKVSRRETET